tara:strand:+ start:443 stop:1279 length:837 start_codon:yes stop_codon:yes gene_type:complete
MNKKRNRKPKLLLVFYGIGRNTSSVIYNMNLIKENLNNFFEIKTAYALNKVKFINNPRTNELSSVNQKGIRKSLSKMNIKFVMDQKIYERKFNIFLKKNISNKFVDPYNDNFRTLCNLFCQLSLLDDFFREKCAKKNYLIFTIRDDIIINNFYGLFSISKILFKYPNYAYTTSYHWHKGVNDRILIFSPYARRIFFFRLKKFKDSLKKGNFYNSEKINMQALDSLGIKIISSPMQIIRVRSNGKIRKEYFFLRIYRFRETLRVLKSIIRYLKILILNR